MRPNRKLNSVPSERINQNDITFGDYSNDWESLANDDLTVVSIPMTDNVPYATSSMDVSHVRSQYQDLPVGQARDVTFHQHFNSVGCSPVMRTRQLMNVLTFDSRNVFPFASCGTNDAGFPGGPESMIPAVPSPPATGLPSQTITSAIHTRPWPCSTCQNAVSFTLEKDLKRHMSTVHATGHESAYYCQCGKRCIRKDNHLRHVHTCKKNDPGLPHYTCKCKMNYLDKRMYVDHVRLNTCEKAT
ncbi:hypothetical protein F5B22DRAFT_660364 [Xylaria bambusicola]|uniref:uncharacterized protein n=1 Tax=Xylaria bambusicola TaxID=326684 RepID=UPI002007EDA8|nr:uncharacterized protein F5B22DRAFT_660364 [Xylaria bambusicola]KAI0506289.1 hypothetical protein F5B22DRAFT_660364 [Xylaria bambusicola]